MVSLPFTITAGRCVGVGVGVLVDRVVPEPPNAWHPVALFGSLMTKLEHGLWSETETSNRGRGLVYTAVGVAFGAATGAVVGRGAVGLGVLATLVNGGGMLGRSATAIGDLLVNEDLDGARAALPALVGRDPSQLDRAQIARAVVESVAENTVDAVVAPALWAVVAGGAGAAGYRAVNTMDAMVGYRSDRYREFGWASARLDDVANLVPARLTATLVALVRPAQAQEVVRLVRRDARAHPSPNGGVAETAFAAALGIHLGGTNTYGDRIEHRGVLGDGPAATAADIGRAVRLSRDVSIAAAGIALAIAAALVALQPQGQRLIDRMLS